MGLGAFSTMRCAGLGATWSSATGVLYRIDFICCATGLFNLRVGTWVEQVMDVATGHHDRIPVVDGSVQGVDLTMFLAASSSAFL